MPVTPRYTSFTDAPERLLPGSVFVAPTDTVYGLSCSVHDARAVARLKELKGKGKDMPLIVLIGDSTQLDVFLDRSLSSFVQAYDRVVSRVWPGPVSVVFRDTLPTWSSISPDGTLAIRLPAHDALRAWLMRVGPIVSTSANMHGEAPATTMEAVLAAFPHGLDFLIDTGVCAGAPSTLVKLLR